MTELKRSLRRELLGRRRGLSVAEWWEASEQICQNLVGYDGFQGARTVLAYFAIDQEPDLSALWMTLAPGKVWGFPRCVGSELVWYGWRGGEPLERNRYGIWEPLAGGEPIEAAAVDLMLVPAVGGDRAGYRLGYGGGFYDRLLGRADWRGVRTIGVTYGFAIGAEMPREPWDQPLGGWCTEQGLSDLGEVGGAKP